MKKLLVVASVALFIVALASSCKGHEKCPAYSKVDTKSTEIPS